MSPAIEGDAFASAPRTSSSHAPPTVAVPAASAAVSQRHYSGPTRPSHTVSNISHTHSRRDPFRVDYGLWPFDDKDYEIVCTVTNHMANTNLPLWTPLLTEDAHRQVCIQYSGRCCNCGSTDHSLRWCPATFTNVFSLLNPAFATHDTDGSMFETWKEKRVGGAAAVRTAGTKVMADVMPLGVATPAPTTEVTVAGPLPRHTSPQLRLNLSRTRAPLALPQPSRLPLSCGMALRSRVTPTRTPADQVRFRCHLLLLLGFYPFCSQKKEQIGTFSHARAELKADSKKEA